MPNHQTKHHRLSTQKTELHEFVSSLRKASVEDKKMFLVLMAELKQEIEQDEINKAIASIKRGKSQDQPPVSKLYRMSPAGEEQEVTRHENTREDKLLFV